jgi:DNA gyrase subunit B
LEYFYRPEVQPGLTSGKEKKAATMKPLYLIENDKDQHEFYCLKEVLAFIRAQANKGIHIQRYKGLGEMNPQQLWETTMDPAQRTILKVALEDAVEVDKTFSILMGDEVAPRREFIEKFAHEVKDLDI